MSSTSITPSFNNMTPKSFWKKPEGKPGMLLTAGIAVGGLYLFWLLLPFLLGVVWGAVNLAIGLIVLGSIAYIVTNPTIKNLVKNIFQSICRGMAMCYTTIDPIGILKNQIDDMRKAKTELDGTVQRFAGSDNNLKAAIAKKTTEVNQLKAKVESAQRLMAKQTDPYEKERIGLNQQTDLEKAGMLIQGVKQIQDLETQTATMLDKFRHWSQISDAKISRTQNRLEFESFRRKTIIDAKSTLSIGMRLLKGDDEQLKLVDGALEFLSEDAARTLGEIQEFNRFSDKMLTDIDIENGANAEEARKMFAEFGTKLDQSAKLPSAVDQLQLPSQSNTPFAQVVDVKTDSDSEKTDSYSNLFVSKK